MKMIDDLCRVRTLKLFELSLHVDLTHLITHDKAIVTEEWTSLCIVEKLNILLSIFKGIECIVAINMGHVS
jgi:hypothetical protein